MFKRLMERLSGKAAPSPVAAPAPLSVKDPRDDELIKFYDGYGREIQITRAQWRDKVLLPNLNSNWDVPDALYNLILSGLKDGEAAERASRLS